MAAFRWFGAVAFACLMIGDAADAAQSPARQAATQPPRQTAPAEPPGGQAPGGQAPEMRIAAVVNDEIISVFDVISRMRMVLLSSNIPDTPETRQKIGAQVLRSLIDERLELQEAKRQNVSASDNEIKHGL